MKDELRVLAAELGKPESEFAPGQCHDRSGVYRRDEGDQMKTRMALLKTLTRQAIDRAKLQRVEVPFTVQPDDLIAVDFQGPRIPGTQGFRFGLSGRSSGQNRKYRCAIGSTSAGSHHSKTPSALT